MVVIRDIRNSPHKKIVKVPDLYYKGGSETWTHRISVRCVIIPVLQGVADGGVETHFGQV